jgi:hypothetical protein
MGWSGSEVGEINLARNSDGGHVKGVKAVSGVKLLKARSTLYNYPFTPFIVFTALTLKGRGKKVRNANWNGLDVD